MKTLTKIILLTLTGITLNSSANNLTLGSTITIVDANKISFTIKWDNSWYASTVPNNWDAVWVFIKYKDCTTTNWLHAPLSTTGTDHTVTGGVLQIDAVTDGMGVFVRRTATGSGNIASSTVTLKLNGIATGTYNFKVFGIEMVKVLNENFQLGDGSSTDRFNSVSITSEAAITAATLGGTSTVDLPAAYPKGWNAFYCMKYEITQEQYVDFLNCLTYDQQATRTGIAPNSSPTNWALGGVSRNGIKLETSGVASTTPAKFSHDYDRDNIYNETNDGQNISCNYISWADLTAYLDWTCLRPMTDLEFEKICRGPLSRIAGEYVWGSNAAITYANGGNRDAWGNQCQLPSNAGAASELPAATPGNGFCATNKLSDCNGNINYNTTSGYTWIGPVRAGFAATATTNRVQAGAAYYGVLDMGGNVWERIVATDATGSTFTGTLGDGTLNATGNANVSNWPGTTAVGSGSRGSSWADEAAYVQLSNRTYATTTNASRTYVHGGRGVR